jgi:hypothetical protein
LSRRGVHGVRHAWRPAKGKPASAQASQQLAQQKVFPAEVWQGEPAICFASADAIGVRVVNQMSALVSNETALIVTCSAAPYGQA